MTYQTRLDAAKAAIASHNASVGDDSHKIDWEKFATELKKMGGTSEAVLAACTWEDLEDCGLPRILARSIAGIFRDKTADTEPEKIVIVDDDPVKRAARMKPEELVTEYDLDDPHNPYGKRLHELKPHAKFIIIENGKVNVAASQKELRRVLDGYASRDQVTVGNEVFKTYRVGEKPDRYVKEHCIYGTPLDEDGCSDKGAAWGELPLEVQQLLNLSVLETNELIPSRYEEFDLFDMVSGKDFNYLAKRYPKAAVLFAELKGLGDLPKLVVQIGNGNGGGGKPNQPFGVNRAT